jgi:hypothetical protein
MCRPSCCPKSTGEGTGIAAVAVIAGAAIVAVKIGPIVARILHLIVEVFIIIMLTAASALACIVLAWLTVRIVRWRIRQHRAHQQMILRPVASGDLTHIRQTGNTPECLACGGTGTVLPAIGSVRQRADLATSTQIRPAASRATSNGGS